MMASKQVIVFTCDFRSLPDESLGPFICRQELMVCASDIDLAKSMAKNRGWKITAHTTYCAFHNERSKRIIGAPSVDLDGWEESR